MGVLLHQRVHPGGAGTLPPPEALVFDPSVSVVETLTVSSGGTNDWHGRSYFARRTDGVLLYIFRRGSSHTDSTSELDQRFSQDNGATWTSLNTKIGGGAIGGMPLNPSTGNVSYGEGRPIPMPNGDIVCLMWSVSGSSSSGTPHGTWISRSTDGGESWGSTSQINFGGGLTQDKVFATDGWFVDEGTGDVYTGARVYNAIPTTDSYVILVKSTDDGATWSYVSDITSAGSDTQEVGLERVGATNLIALVGSLNNDETIKATSSDMGLHWSLTDVTATELGVSRRHNVYTKSRLQGLSNWWLDPKLIAVGFENQNPGSSQSRRNAVWLSDDSGANWKGPFYIDSTTEDAGYGDVFYDSDNDEWVVITYQGTLAAASLKQYRLSITGW